MTVRHPIESYISADEKNWLITPNGSQMNLEEYCLRYTKFLNAYHGIHIFFYEKICLRPVTFLKNLASIWMIEYAGNKEISIQGKRMSGDSGRSSNIIELRAAKAQPDRVIQESLSCNAYRIYVID